MQIKRIFSSFTVVALMLGLVACGGGDPNPPPSDNKPPVALFTSSATTPALTPLVFDASTSSDPENDPLVYSWDFGDVEHGGGAKIAHQFAKAGSFTVKLTVADGKGGSNSTTKTITVSSNGTAGASVTVTGQVADVNGALAGVKVEEIGGTISSVTAADGTVSIALSVGVPHTLKLSKTGYADQFQPINLPSSNTDGFFKVGMMAREAAQNLNASSGGSLTGKDSAKITLPPSGLVDSSGNPVSGTVQIALSPVDISGKMISSFPGQFAGVKLDGTQTPIASYGTTEFALSQNGKRLQLAAGKTATIELPIYATQNFDGSSLKVGDSIPLWSLSETTGLWVQEGLGIVVSSSAPSGLALRATVSHFSWWNADVILGTPYLPKPKCLLSPAATPTACTISPQLPNINQPPQGFSSPPNYNIKADISLAGDVAFPVPAGFDFTFHACAKNGTYCGFKLVNGAAGVSNEVVILLNPVATGGSCGSPTVITTPLEQDYTLASVAQADCFSLNLQAGQIIGLAAKQANGSVLTGSVQLSKPDGTALGSTDFGVNAGMLEFVIPTTGLYQIKLNALTHAPGGYHLSVAQPVTPTPLTQSVLLDDQIPTGTFAKYFTVNALAGDKLNLSILLSNLQVQVQMLGSSELPKLVSQASFFQNMSFIETNSAITSVFKVFRNSSGSAGADIGYTLRLKKALPFTLGTPITDTISSAADSRVYTVQGVAGTLLNASVWLASQLTDSLDLPSLSFYAVNGSLSYSSLNGATQSGTLPVGIKQNTTVWLIVSPEHNRITNFTLNALAVQPPTPVALTGITTTVSSSLNAIGDIKFYSFNLNAGDNVKFLFSSPGTLTAGMYIFSPTSSLNPLESVEPDSIIAFCSSGAPSNCATQTKTFVAPSSGQYMVAITAIHLAQFGISNGFEIGYSTGSFSWSLIKPDIEQTSINTLYDDSINSPYGLRRHNVSISNAGYYLFRSVYPSGNNMTQQLYDSSMNQRTGFLGFIGNSDTSFEKMYKLEPGNYILEQESTYSATQPCSSILVNIQPPTSISSGTPLNGNISQAGKREYYTFNGTSGQAMTIKVTAGGGLVGNTRVIQPYGVGYEFYQGTIVKPSLPFGTAFSFTPSSSGTFEIEVDGDANSTGTYSIALN